MNTEKSIRGQRAKDNFNSGYNCSQSVLLAYEDYLQEKGLDPKTVLRMASPMGGRNQPSSRSMRCRLGFMLIDWANRRI